VFDADLDELLRRPAVTAAVRDLNVSSLALEDVLGALRSLGQVRITVTGDPERPFSCVLDAGEGCEHGHGHSVLTAAVACWAEALDAVGYYSRRGVADLERFLGGFA
jgi:hypothetical protein